jgi:hypothetical protein
MPQPAAPLGAVRAIGRPDPGGPWVGFAFRGNLPRVVIGMEDGMLETPAEADLLLALAIGYFAEAFVEPPPDLEATQSDLSSLVRYLIGVEVDGTRRAALGEALDAIDDGLAGDAVAGLLLAARTDELHRVDPVELVLARMREMQAAG